MTEPTRRAALLSGLGLGALAACAPQPSPLPDAEAERAYPPLGRIATVDGLPVHALDAGDGPPVVLLHGASANLRDWSFSHVARLAKRYRVLAMDRPGFGYSGRDDGDWSPSRQAAQLRRAAEALGVERPIVVGHSWGAAVALAWALDAPVRGVVAISGATMPWGVAADVAGALGIGRLGVDVYTARLSSRTDRGAIEEFIARAFTPQTPPTGYLDHVGAALSLRAGTLAANADDLAGLHRWLSEQSRRYPSLRAPVEIIHGDADWLLGVRRHAEGLAALAPQARVSIAEGVGHMAHHARPDLLDATLERLAG